MSEPLTGTQEEHAREIAKQEVASFVRLLLAELNRAPRYQRAIIACVQNAHRRFNEGDVVS